MGACLVSLLRTFNFQSFRLFLSSIITVGINIACIGLRKIFSDVTGVTVGK